MMSHLPPNPNTIPMLMGSGLPPHSLQLSHLPPNHHSLATPPQTSTAIAQVPSRNLFCLHLIMDTKNK